MNNLESLRKYTTVVADTGDIEAIAKYKPQDATTNPSLLLKAAQMPQYRPLVEEALRALRARSAATSTPAREAFMDKLAVNFGCEILKIIPGRVSTEVDATYSFDTEGTIAKARSSSSFTSKAGIDARAHPDQGRQHLGGHQGRRAAGAGGHPLQPDPAVQLRPGGGLRRGQGHPDLARSSAASTTSTSRSGG